MPRDLLSELQSRAGASNQEDEDKASNDEGETVVIEIENNNQVMRNQTFAQFRERTQQVGELQAFSGYHIRSV